MKIEGLCKSYGDRVIFDGLSFELPDSGVISLMGPSGCGKTTLLRILSRLEEPDSAVFLPTFSKISYVFQEPRLIPSLTAAENVVCASGVTDGEACEMLSRLGFSDDDCRKLPSELSGGMKQRVSITRALLFNGEIFLLDEAFKGLDAELKEICAGLITEKAQRAPVIFVTHDRDEADLLGGSVALLSGTPAVISVL